MLIRQGLRKCLLIFTQILESSSDTTSRETTPESDDENDDEVQDEDEDDQFADEESTFTRNDSDNDDGIPTNSYNSHPARDTDELITSYAHLFMEYEVLGISKDWIRYCLIHVFLS